MTNDNNKNTSLSSAYLEHNIEGISILIDTVNETMSALFTPQFNVIFENLSATINQFLPSYESLINNTAIDAAYNACNQLLDVLKDIHFAAYDFSSLSSGISIQDDCITLDVEVIDTIEGFFTENTGINIPTVKSHMPIKDFLLTVLLPLLSLLLPLLLDVCYHKMDSIESQQQYTQISERLEYAIELNEHQLESSIIQTQEIQKQTVLLENLIKLLSSSSEEEQEFLEAILQYFEEESKSPEDTLKFPDNNAVVSPQAPPTRQDTFPELDISGSSPCDIDDSE